MTSFKDEPTTPPFERQLTGSVAIFTQILFAVVKICHENNNKNLLFITYDMNCNVSSNVSQNKKQGYVNSQVNRLFGLLVT